MTLQILHRSEHESLYESIRRVYWEHREHGHSEVIETRKYRFEHLDETQAPKMGIKWIPVRLLRVTLLRENPSVPKVKGLKDNILIVTQGLGITGQEQWSIYRETITNEPEPVVKKTPANNSRVKDEYVEPAGGWPKHDHESSTLEGWAKVIEMMGPQTEVEKPKDKDPNGVVGQ